MTGVEREIELEAAACRAAHEGVKVGSLEHCAHHDDHYELLLEPAEERIQYILNKKPLEERALRLRLFRPVNGAPEFSADYQKAYTDYQKTYDDWQRTETDYRKAKADLQKIEPDWQKAYADCQKAYADCQKAYADWKMATAAYITEHAEELARLHAEQFPSCPWNGKSIFG